LIHRNGRMPPGDVTYNAIPMSMPSTNVRAAAKTTM